MTTSRWPAQFGHFELIPLLDTFELSPGYKVGSYVNAFEYDLSRNAAFCKIHPDKVNFIFSAGKLLVSETNRNSMFYHALSLSFVTGLKDLIDIYKVYVKNSETN